MKQRIVLALGRNALGYNLHEQMLAVRETVRAIADLVEAGHEVVVAHGTGPQVGMITQALDAAGKTEVQTPYIPMSVCVAMSQGYVGYDLQNSLREELLNRGIDKPVVTVITQTVVDENDPAFLAPTKPIGPFYTRAEAKAMERLGHHMQEDAGRGYRRVMASPAPIDIVEKDAIDALLKAGQVPIAAGGGGIPVRRMSGNRLKGISAMVDKDFAAAKLAELIHADFLVILTAVEKVAVNFGKPDEIWLDRLDSASAKRYIGEGHFAKGSMLPKVEAALTFVHSGPGRRALITKLQKAKEGMAGKTGTIFVNA